MLKNCVSEVLRLLRLGFPPPSLPGLHHQQYTGWSFLCAVGCLPGAVRDKSVPFIGADSLEVLLIQLCTRWRCVPRQFPPSPQLERPGGFSVCPGKDLIFLLNLYPYGSQLPCFDRYCFYLMEKNRFSHNIWHFQIPTVLLHEGASLQV